MYSNLVGATFFFIYFVGSVLLIFLVLTIQGKLKGQSRMDNPEKTEGAIKNGQSREN
jgi:hypothetical protein